VRAVPSVSRSMYDDRSKDIVVRRQGEPTPASGLSVQKSVSLAFEALLRLFTAYWCSHTVPV